MVKDVLISASEYLNLPDLNFDTPNRETSLLLKAFNVVCKELASDYFPLTQIDKIASFGGKILYNNLTNRVLKINAIKCEKGNVRFRVFSSFIKVDFNGAVEVTYNYLPSDLVLTDNLPWSFITETVMAYGVAGEFALLKNMFAESEIFTQKFLENINNLTKFNLAKERRWF
ncbi:MAG: hypothetical protein RR374_03880 [Clostridia bacterium]